MDTTTHALAGYMIAKTSLGRDTGKWGTIAGVSATIFPDMDLVLRPFLSAEFTLRYHRHLTNSFFSSFHSPSSSGGFLSGFQR